MSKQRLLLALLAIIVINTPWADTFTNRAVIITQDGELKNGEVVYVVSIEKKGENYMVNRFCFLEIDRWHECRLTYDTPSGSDVIHVPHNILDIAEEEVNRQAAGKYSFYKPQVWTIGVWE